MPAKKEHAIAETLAFPDATNHRITGHGTSAYATDTWGINNSTLETYSQSIFDEEEPDFLARFLMEKIGNNNAAIDLAGGRDGVAMQRLVELAIVGRGVVTNLKDTRSKQSQAHSGIHHISGDLLHGSTWDKIERWQRRNARQGFGLILHHPVGGMQWLDPLFYEQAIERLIPLIRPGGYMITQVPTALAEYPKLKSPALDAICKKLRENPEVEATSRESNGRLFAFIEKIA